MKGQQIYKQALKKIPAGTQLLSKRPEMYLPEQWPSYYSKAKGVEVWDLDNKRYIDMSNCSVGACVLGYADPDVDSAVRAAIEQGSISTLNCLEEVELADLLCELHPWADMVRYARSGGEAMAAAVRIARANSGKDKIAFCGYHGWHDWYLAANIGEHDALDGHLLPGLSPAGVPRALANTALPFHYNKIEELEEIVSIHSKDLGTIVMEPIRSYNPESNFLAHVREIASDIGAVLVFDEITSGWRLNNGGAHLKIGVNPDIAVFSKAMSNGYPMASIIGTKSVMQAAENTFISSTYWTERIGPTAALATIQKYGNCNVSKHLRYIGECIQDIWMSTANKIGLPIEVG
ncbi:MAG: aminotransferase class III-fold pyridoxal phosphate-dependent enzyme, partial [Chloroflexota bacterium]|nr:aminotransferase class III-fold pyridoxal phosphate-dependent enzyme [Chloroflexota bacterium]